MISWLKNKFDWRGTTLSVFIWKWTGPWFQHRTVSLKPLGGGVGVPIWQECHVAEKAEGGGGGNIIVIVTAQSRHRDSWGISL